MTQSDRQQQTSQSTAPLTAGLIQPVKSQKKEEWGSNSVENSVSHESQFRANLAEVPVKPIVRTLTQPKLRVGAANDRYEQEADRIAEQVVQQINASKAASPKKGQALKHRSISDNDKLQMKPSVPIQEAIEEDDELQMKPLVRRVRDEKGAVSKDLEGEIDRAREGGQSLAPELQAQMGQAMGAHFGRVRAHTDARSDQLNRSLQAQAFTTGHHIFFRQGNYRPSTPTGQKLIAHELVHVLQQQTDRDKEALQRKAYLHNPDDLIYKDTEQKDLELAYLGKAGERPVFAEYAKVLTLVNNIKENWNELGRKNQKNYNSIEDYIQLNQELTTAIQVSIGQIYFEDVDGTLKIFANPSGKALVASVGAIARQGPLYINVGGGSRLPAPKGVIFVRSDATATKADVLTILGIPNEEFASYSEVELHRISKYEQWREQYKNSGENFIDGQDFFYVSTVEARRSANARVRAAGKVYDDNFTGVVANSKEAKQLKQSFEGLTAPALQNWQSGSKLTKTDRGEGQAKAMGDWNALGAAAFANWGYGKTYKLDQNWEWLHIQGAQIGGKTEGGNLVPGLFVANSAMIPFENMIAKWANLASDKMMARFKPGNKFHSFTDSITLEIIARDHPTLGTITTADPLSISFDPINGKVVDKLTEKIKERNLDRTPLLEFGRPLV